MSWNVKGRQIERYYRDSNYLSVEANEFIHSGSLISAVNKNRDKKVFTRLTLRWKAFNKFKFFFQKLSM